MPHQPSAILSARGLHKTYREGGADLRVLRGVDLDVGRGEFVAILGRSGSGKSTLLHMLGGLDRPTSGSVHFDGRDIAKLRGRRLDRYRNAHAGFVFQQYHLLPELTALENVLISAMVGRSLVSWTRERADVRRRARQLLKQVGLSERIRHRPAKLSGGERQRVAVARALINKPAVLLADEPTGNLDAQTSASMMDLLKSLHAQGQTLVLVTHDAGIAEDADRRLELKSGALADPAGV